MNNRLTNNIVRKYLEEELIPHLNRAIDHRISQNNVVSNMPIIISEKMVIGLLDSSIKNSNISTNLGSEIKEIQQKPHKKMQIKVPQKKIIHESKFLTNPQQNRTPSKHQEKILKTPIKHRSQLIKLPIQQSQQDKQVQQIILLKQKMRKFTQQTQLRKQFNEKARKRQRSFKKYALNDSIQHTYDYETNLLAVNQAKLKDFLIDSHQKSLLQILKTNLDTEIRQQNLYSRLKNLSELKQQNKTKINKKEIKIKNIDSQQRQNPQPQKKYRPFHFHVSNIHSLAKQIDKDISSGVKMITYQQKLVEQHLSTRDKKFTLLKKQIIKQKKKDKLDTQGSQSIIYSLEKKWNKELGDDRKSTLGNNKEQMEKYYSIQYDNENDNCKPVFSKQSSKLSDSSLGVKLPEINLFGKKSPPNSQRILTEQKMVKKLSDVEIKIRNRNEDIVQDKDRERSGIFSAYEMKKQTQSSLSDDYNKSSRNSKNKKQYIKKYFKNYAEQFRHKLTSKDQTNSLYLL